LVALGFGGLKLFQPETGVLQNKTNPDSPGYGFSHILFHCFNNPPRGFQEMLKLQLSKHYHKAKKSLSFKNN